MAIDPNQFWDADDEEPKRPGVTSAEIAAWEKRRGVTLPEFLRNLLVVQNGGIVRYEPIRVLPLEEMAPPDQDFWNWAIIHDEEGLRDHSIVITFAWADEEPQYLLNFNAGGPHGEPTVYSQCHDPGDMLLEANSVEDFFARLLKVETAPAVDWTETSRLDVVLFRERIDFDEHGGDEYVLGRQNGVLVLFTRDLDGSVLCKTTIPEPVSTSVEECRPGPGKTFGLNLEPENPDRILCVESTRMADGTWKNRTDRGVPVYVTVESRDRKLLQALREGLIGKAAVKKEDRESWWWTWVWTPLIVLTCLPCVIPVLAFLYTLRLVFWIFSGRGAASAPQTSGDNS